ncbi:MAG: COR domain-containing protein [Prosthecobacter sp.]
MKLPYLHSPKTAPDWTQWPVPSPEVTKIVIGKLTDAPDKKLSLGDLPEDFPDRFPNLKLLHLWGLKGLRRLPPLPAGLVELDVRKCADLEELPELPEGLEVLVIGDAPRLKALEPARCGPALMDLALTNCPQLVEGTIHSILEVAPRLEELDLSGCGQVTRLRDLPERVTVLRADRLEFLKGLRELPMFLRRLDLRESAVENLPDFPDALDYVDLRDTRSLERLPDKIGKPRTLLMQGSGLGKVLPDELFGEGVDYNSAPNVLAHFERARTLDHEIKVILLGNGRAGKSSLARRLSAGTFDPNEVTTHGIRLWSFPLEFSPVDEPHASAKATVNVWDFAGQDLYHHTHRLFFQNKAIFLVCDTAAGPGASPEGDGQDDDLLPKGWDVNRNLLYWREQIEALGSSPGMDGPPPLLVIRTKADRDHEAPAGQRKKEFITKCGEALQGLELIDFGAESGEGLEALQTAIKKAVADVLGARGKREIREDALAVKDQLRALMQQNANEFRTAEAEDRPAQPPFPTLTRDAFHALVKQHCAGTIYDQKPDTLLQQWHWTGFLYYQPRYLPEIVLDQRWVIQGIYSGLDRERSWKRLLAKGGRFTAEDLAQWAWNDAGYSAAHQALFLQFMKSCGMVFRFGERSGTDEYVMLNALPERNADTERLAIDYRAGTLETRRVALQHRHLSRDAVLELLAQMGEDWRKSGLLWRWGGQFESFRHAHSWEHNRPRSFAYLDWRPRVPDSFGGTLAITLYGDDEEFLNDILRECQKLQGFEAVKFPEIKEPDLADLKQPDQPERQSAKPGAFHADGIEVGISFAGDFNGPCTSWRDLPADSIERWPRALTEELVKLGFRVEQYRIEQGRDEIDRTTDRKAYLDTLTDKDFMFAFLSWEYLKSPWCMYEFMRIWQAQSPPGKQDPAKTKIAAFEDAYFSQSDPDQEHWKRFKKHWNVWYLAFEKRIREDTEGRRSATVYDAAKRVKDFGFGEWHECLSDETNLDRIASAIFGSGWQINKVRKEPGDTEMVEWKRHLMTTFQRVDHLLDLAVEAWNKKEYDRAQRIYLRAVLGLAPDNQPMEEVLRKGISQPQELKLIRSSILSELREHQDAGVTFANWMELADAIAPTTSETSQS